MTTSKISATKCIIFEIKLFKDFSNVLSAGNSTVRTF